MNVHYITFMAQRKTMAAPIKLWRTRLISVWETLIHVLALLNKHLPGE